MAKMFNQRWRNLTLAAAVTATLAACGGGGGGGGGNPTPPAGAVGDTFAVTNQNRIVTFTRASAAVTSAVAITGLATGDTVVGFDVRPQTNDLVALTNNAGVGKVYLVNPTTGAATLVATLNNSTANVAPVAFTGLTGTKFGVDFNPVPDRLRIVSDTGQNLRVNLGGTPAGQAIVDGGLNLGGTAKTGLSEAGYSNNGSNACRTTLFYIDPSTNTLFNTANPNGGVLTSVGPLGVTTTSANVGFEIITTAAGANTAIAALKVAAAEALYTINTTTGAATLVNTFTGLNTNEEIIGLGVTTPASLTAQAVGDMVGLNETNQLFTFNAAAPNKLCTSPVTVAPLNAGENVVGIDTRPATGAVYGVGVNAAGAARVFVIDKATAATSAPQNITIGGTAVTLTGTNFGVDFNPVPDRLRLTNDAASAAGVPNNLRINVADGTAILDGPINSTPAGATVTAAAYTNSFGPAAPSTTTLYTIDSAAGALNIQNPPNNGTQAPVGTLGITGGITGVSGFDINGQNNTAVAGLTVGANTTTTLYTINLATGAATAVAGNIGAGVGVGTAPLTGRVRGLTFNNNPQASVVAITQTGNQLVTFNPATAATVSTPSAAISITGLQGGENIIGADFRAANGLLYALTDAARTYVINTTTGAATQMIAFTAATGSTFTTADFVGRTAFGVDFNPMADRLRTVTAGPVGTNNNLRSALDGVAGVTAGTTFSDTSLSRSIPTLLPPTVKSVAYSNSTPGTPAPTVTTLFTLDTTNDRLFVQNPPNNGSQVAVGSLGVDAVSVGGFDIIGQNTAFAVLTTAATLTTPAVTNGLYSINLANGAATLVGTIATTAPANIINGFALPVAATDPAATAPPTATAIINGGPMPLLATFTASAAGVATVSSVGITNVAAGETLLDIDFRPATATATVPATPATSGTLYAAGSLGNIYTISQAGLATNLGPLTNAATLGGSGVAFTGVQGTVVGIDFNPVPDRLRYVTDATPGQNLRINVGAANNPTLLDGPIALLALANFPAINGAAAAYTNNFSPTPTSTILYDLDLATNTLQIQGAVAPPGPNGGVLTQVGRLDTTFNFSSVASFDIAGGENGLALAVLQRITTPAVAAVGATPAVPAVLAPQTSLYRVNLATGQATLVGDIGSATTPVLYGSVSIQLR